MRGVTLTGTFFQRRNGPSSAGQESKLNTQDIKMVNLKLRFNQCVAHRVYDDYGDANVGHNEDGTLELSISFPEDEWVYGYLLSFGPDVLVLEPVRVRDRLRARMQEALQLYA